MQSSRVIRECLEYVEERKGEMKRDQGWIVSPYCYRQMLHRFHRIPRRNLRGITSFAHWQQIPFALYQQRREKCWIYIHVNARGIENSLCRSGIILTFSCRGSSQISTSLFVSILIIYFLYIGKITMSDSSLIATLDIILSDFKAFWKI